MVIGAFALSAWGRPRATLDLDFIIQASEVPESLIGIFTALGVRYDKEGDRYNPMIRAFHKRFRSGRIPVDILLSRDKHDLAAFARRRKKRFEGKYLWFPSAEDFLIQKLKVGRPQDFVDAAAIVERMGPGLDRKYLGGWPGTGHPGGTGVRFCRISLEDFSEPDGLYDLDGSLAIQSVKGSLVGPVVTVDEVHIIARAHDPAET